jgi:hypothetical protein
MKRQLRRLGLAMCGVLLMATAAHGDASAPTFNADIAPLVYGQCMDCHRQGEAGPFALGSYAEVKKRAKQIVKVTTSRYMPPWKADAGDLKFVGARHLSNAQIALFRAWFEAGCPEGEGSAPEPPKFPAGWRLGTPDLVVKMPEAYEVPAEGRDIYRCFVIPVKIPAGKYVRAMEYRPGNRRVVHHAVLTTMPPEEVAQRMEKDGDGSGPGWRSGLAPPGNLLPGPMRLWVPGMDPLPQPEGYAMAWPQDAQLVLQLHLHPDGKAEREQSTVGLFFTDEAPTGRLQNLVLMNKKVDIAPGDGAYRLERSFKVPVDVELIGLFPHMHLLGKSVVATATFPDGSTRRLLTIADWDFNWQGYYSCAEPLRLPAGTVLHAVWTFDNSAQNPRNPSTPPKRVRFGEQTTDEMGVLMMDVVAAGKGTPARAFGKGMR